MNNEKINEIKSLDQYFPKGDKRRGEALVLVAEAFLLGKECAQKDKKEIESESEEYGSPEPFILEALLDIRDLLKKFVKSEDKFGSRKNEE